MPSCVLRYCTNYAKKTNKAHGITYHKFPSDELVRQEWIDFVRKQRSEHDWTPAKTSSICSNHFDSKYKYTSAKGRILLNKTAVPVLKVAAAVPEDSQRAASPNSLNSVDISDTESIFEPPKEAILKRKLQAEQMRNKKLMHNNKILKQRVRRLMKTCKLLKEALNQCTKVMTKSDIKPICEESSETNNITVKQEEDSCNQEVEVSYKQEEEYSFKQELEVSYDQEEEYSYEQEVEASIKQEVEDL